jgi:hypothetical protein
VLRKMHTRLSAGRQVAQKRHRLAYVSAKVGAGVAHASVRHAALNGDGQQAPPPRLHSDLEPTADLDRKPSGALSGQSWDEPAGVGTPTAVGLHVECAKAAQPAANDLSVREIIAPARSAESTAWLLGAPGAGKAAARDGTHHGHVAEERDAASDGGCGDDKVESSVVASAHGNVRVSQQALHIPARHGIAALGEDLPPRSEHPSVSCMVAARPRAVAPVVAKGIQVAPASFTLSKLSACG